MAQSSRTKGAKGPSDRADDLARLIEQRLQALDAINELRAPLWEALVADLDKGRPKDSFVKRATTLGKRMERSLEEFRAGQKSRIQAIKSYQNLWQSLRDDFEARSVESLWKNAKLHPSPAS